MSPSVRPHRIRTRIAAFTLLELMVSMSVLAIIMVLVFQMLGSTQRAWSDSRARLSTFKEARVAFESMTRRISQATLNTYWDYDNLERPTKYTKQSDLHFVCAPTEKLLSGGDSRPGHAIFFQAPVGFTLDKNNQQFTHLLNGWGYFIEFNDGKKYAPGFLPEDKKDRPRFRLMEFRPPSENLAVYKNDLRASNVKKGAIDEWFKDEVDKSSAAGKPYTRPIAENILLLVIQPRESDADRNSSNKLAPKYMYDSRADKTKRGVNKESTRHTLPPIIDVTMVAMDEDSAIRYMQIHSNDMSGLNLGELFTSTNSYESDLEKLKEKLWDADIDFRVFHESVHLKASDWDAAAIK